MWVVTLPNRLQEEIIVNKKNKYLGQEEDEEEKVELQEIVSIKI